MGNGIPACVGDYAARRDGRRSTSCARLHLECCVLGPSIRETPRGPRVCPGKGKGAVKGLEHKCYWEWLRELELRSPLSLLITLQCPERSLR